MRKTRHEAASLLESVRNAFGEERREQDRLDSALNALKNSGPDERLEQLSNKRKQDHASAVELIRELTRSHEEISEVLRRREAYICQFELLDFLTSQRYTLAPLSLANAMAGLPLIAWRQSIKRCAENIRRNGGTLSYQIFKEVTRALAGPPQTASRTVAQVRTHLVKKRRKPGPAILMLKDDFYYLRVSIEAVYFQKPPRSAIPFRVSAEYFKRSASRSPYDQVIAEEDRL